MRALCLAVLAAVTITPALAQRALPDGVEQLMTCGTVYSLQSEAAQEAGDEGGATEYFNRGDNAIWRGKSTMQAAGMTEEEITDVEMNSALMIGFRYGGGEAETMLAECLAAEDSP